jgi:ribosomal protein S18 acetylase RimI-like enzyme
MELSTGSAQVPQAGPALDAHKRLAELELPAGIRYALPTDLDQLCRLESVCFSDDMMSRRSLQRFLVARGNALVVAPAAALPAALPIAEPAAQDTNTPESLAGYALVLLPTEIGIARLYSLCVDPVHQRRGLGRTLLRTTEQLARAAGMEAYQLEVRADNPAGILLYEAEGWSYKAMLPNYYEDGSDGFRLWKALT